MDSSTFLIIIIAIIVLYTLFTGLRAIIITWKNCMAVGSTKGFFSDIWNGSGGNIFLILGVLILCVPVYILLSSRIKSKMKKVSYRVETRYVNKQIYKDAFQTIKERLAAGDDSDAIKQDVIQQLVNQNESYQDAEESVLFYILLHRFQQERK